MVYALDASNGVALWTARFRPEAKRGEPTGNGGAAPFQPVPLGTGSGLQNVLVAFEGGVRAIEGATGQELWRAALPGHIASGISGDLNGDGTMKVALFQDNPAGLSFLDASTGRVLAQEKLEAIVVGAPAAYMTKAESGVLLALADGTLDLRNIKGERLRMTKLDVQFTTPPLIVQTPQSTLAMIGTDHGLIAIDVATLKPLWRVATEGDAPRGQLSAADLDNDGAPEVVMITQRGRTVTVSTSTGKIKWYANIPNHAGTATLTDLNGDSVADVLIASDSSSLIGHEGRNGTLLFGGDGKGTINTTGNPEDGGVPYQTCAYLGGRNNSPAAPFVVCNDLAGGGLRAVSLPPGK
jgi:outer membrane protein assembly factor BamB